MPEVSAAPTSTALPLGSGPGPFTDFLAAQVATKGTVRPMTVLTVARSIRG